MRTSMIFFVFLLVPIAAFSKTINVPGDFNTIQAAIDAAANGDTILVQPGTYTENIRFKGKAITVKSSNGAGSTAIDGGKVDTVVKFLQSEKPDSILEGFTITNGAPSGILCINAASPTIQHNTITNNYSFLTGGGMACGKDCTPRVLMNIISNNNVDSPAGCSGGGILCSNESSEFLIAGNMFVENGVNPMNGDGGGLECSGPGLKKIVSNTFIANYAYSGGGIFCQNTNAVLVNNTFSENDATDGGGLACLYEASDVTIVNSIFWGNMASLGPSIYIDSSSTVSISYSDVDGWKPSVNVEPGSTLNWGKGMIGSDPLFVNHNQGDLHITYKSPCKDAGNDSAPHLSAYDFEGDPRIAGKTVDIGADEFHRHLYYTGNAVPGETVGLHFVGGPGKAIMIFVGAGVLDPPLPSPYGDWYLKFPLLFQGSFGVIPPHGVSSSLLWLDPTTPTPLDLPMQGAIGVKLTNLSVLEVR